MATLSTENEFEPRWLRRITRSEYHRMGDDGYFDDALGEQHVELLDGLVFDVTPPKAPHSWTVGRIARLFRPLEDLAEVRSEQPLVLSDWSEPEPDLSIVPLGDYRTEQPTTALLVVEVSHTTLAYDRRFKRRIYAEAGLPEYWVVNLVDRVVEVWTDPRDGAYATQCTYGPGETLSPKAFPDLVLAVADLLP